MEVILVHHLKSSIIESNPNAHYEFQLNNLFLNNEEIGCAGFICNTDSNSFVFVSTDIFAFMRGKYLYRYADEFNDYEGYHNHWATSLEELSKGIIKLLEIPVSKTQEKRL